MESCFVDAIHFSILPLSARSAARFHFLYSTSPITATNIVKTAISHFPKPRSAISFIKYSKDLPSCTNTVSYSRIYPRLFIWTFSNTYAFVSGFKVALKRWNLWCTFFDILDLEALNRRSCPSLDVRLFPPGYKARKSACPWRHNQGLCFAFHRWCDRLNGHPAQHSSRLQILAWPVKSDLALPSRTMCQHAGTGSESCPYITGNWTGAQ